MAQRKFFLNERLTLGGVKKFICETDTTGSFLIQVVHKQCTVTVKCNKMNTWLT